MNSGIMSLTNKGTKSRTIISKYSKELLPRGKAIFFNN